MMTSTYAELTPVSSSASSSDFSLTQDTKLNEFNKLVAELGFDEYSEVYEAPEENALSESEDSDEDVNVEYPYQRKDKYAGLREKLERSLLEKDFETTEIDMIAEDVKQQVKLASERRKMEAKQPGVVHTVGSLFQCVVCAKSFPSSAELEQHTKKSHDVSANQYRCKLCGNRYRHRKNLLSHMKIHEKEYSCKKCDLVFQTAQTLENHIIKIHLEDHHEQAFIEKVCRICAKRVPENTVKQHEWYCANKQKILEKKRANLEALRKQSVSVPTSPAMSVASVSSFASFQPTPSSPVVSYRDKSCRVCGESFASRQSMLRHVGRKHPEVKDDPNVTAVRYVSTESPSHQYACEDCGKRLTTRAALTSHRARAHLNTARHECPECHKMFIVPSELRKHIQRTHEKSKTINSAIKELPDFDSIF